MTIQFGISWGPFNGFCIVHLGLGATPFWKHSLSLLLLQSHVRIDVGQLLLYFRFFSAGTS